MPHRHSIPAEIEPIDDISVCVPIPNHPDYVAAFLFVIRQLTLDRHWEHTENAEALTVRRVWSNRTLKPITDQLSSGNYCDMLANCDDIADCIDTTQSVQNSINTTVKNYGVSNPDTVDPDTPLIDTRFQQLERDTDIKSNPPSCNKDALWAGIRESVVRLDDGARQFLEQAVAQADKAERAALIIEMIPIVGDLAAGVVKQFSELAPDLLNLFNAYSSQANIDDISCSLFEIVCQECRYPTYQEYWDYFSTAGISGLSDIGSLTFTAITDLLFGTQNLAALVAYHTIIAYELYTLYLGSKFTSFRGTKWLGIWASFGEDLPNNNWEILCTGCADPVGDAYFVDFTAGNTGLFSIVTGTIQSGIGISSVPGGQPETIIIKIESVEAWACDRFEAVYTRQSDGSQFDDIRVIGWTDINAGTGRVDTYEYNEPSYAQQEVSHCAEIASSASRNDWGFYWRENSAGNTIILKSLKIWSSVTLPSDILPNDTQSVC